MERLSWELLGGHDMDVYRISFDLRRTRIYVKRFFFRIYNTLTLCFHDGVWGLI